MTTNTIVLEETKVMMIAVYHPKNSNTTMPCTRMTEPPQSPLSDREEQLLAAVVTGERASDDPEVAAAAAQNAEFAAAMLDQLLGE